MEFYTLNIKEVIKETENAISITFSVPQDLKPKFAFVAGQYITLKTTIEGDEIRRDYSLCTNPNSDTLKVVVKEVVDGRFSKYVNTELKAGDSLEVATPRGRFTFEPSTYKKRTIVAFAAGSGITPIMSIAKTVLENEPQSSFMLVYGNKTPKDTIFFNDLLDLQKNHQDRFYLKFVFSKSTEDDALFGRIEPSTAHYILNKAEHVDAFYLCGPEAMIHTISDSLINKGFSKDHIHFELFTAPSESDDINTSIDVQDGNTTVTVLVDDEEHRFVMPQTKTILESALEHKIDAPYSCQGGICSSCIAKLTSGKAEMRQNNILTDGELAEGLILTCQAQPTTSSVSIDYDDV